MNVVDKMQADEMNVLTISMTWIHCKTGIYETMRKVCAYSPALGQSSDLAEGGTTSPVAEREPSVIGLSEGFWLQAG